MKNLIVATIFIVCFLYLSSCFTNNAENIRDGKASDYAERSGYLAVSMSGKKLFYAPELPKETKDELEKKLAEAKKNYEREPNEQNTIWYGRYLAYLYKFDEALQAYQSGLKRFPQSEKILRHLGHRYITLRKLDKAIIELEKAAKISKDKPVEVERDGIPNKANKNLTNTHFNVWYHLGLAYYFKGENNNALDAFNECMKYARNDDTICSVTHWLYMTYRRLGLINPAERLLFQIKNEMNVIENQAYHKLLLMYKGLLTPDELLEVTTEDSEEAKLHYVTIAYGIGNWYLSNKQDKKAREIFHKIIETNHWTAFGYIGAEVDLLRIGN